LDGLAERAAREPQLVAELLLGREPIAGREPARHDHVLDARDRLVRHRHAGESNQRSDVSGVPAAEESISAPHAMPLSSNAWCPIVSLSTITVMLTDTDDTKREMVDEPLKPSREEHDEGRQRAAAPARRRCPGREALANP